MTLERNLLGGTDPAPLSTAEAPRAAPAVDRAWFVLAAAIVALIAVFHDTAAFMVRTWSVSDTYNHGFLMVPLAVYLGWTRAARLRQLAPRPALWALPLMAGFALVWLLGNVASVQVVQQLALVAMVQSLFLVVLGVRIALVLAVPLAYLVFAVPFGQGLVPLLQDVTAAFVVKGLRLLDIPVFLDGVFLYIPTGAFVVAEECAGVRFLIATMALGCFFVDITYRALWRKLVFLVLCVVVTIAANGFRALGIVVIAYMTDHRVAVGVDHLIYGWVFFSFVTILLLLLGMTFRDKEIGVGAVGAVAALPPRGRGAAGWRPLGAALAAVMLAVAGPGYRAVIESPPPGELAAPLVAPAAEGWRRLDAPPADSWQPRYAGADAVLRAVYAGERRTARVHLYVAYYLYPRKGAEVVGGGNSVVGGDGWSQASIARRSVAVEGTELRATAIRMVRRSGGRIVWHWNWIGDAFVADPYAAKAREAMGKLLGRSPAAAAIAIAADYHDDPAEAEAVLAEFVARLEPMRPMLRRLDGR